MLIFHNQINKFYLLVLNEVILDGISEIGQSYYLHCKFLVNSVNSLRAQEALSIPDILHIKKDYLFKKHSEWQ